MKTKSFLVIASSFGLLLSAIGAETAAPSPRPTAAATSAEPSTDPSRVPIPSELRKTKPAASATESSKSLTPDLAENKPIEEARRAHIRSSTSVAIDTPPPARRAETPPKPSSRGMAWIPGYWKPVESKWQWVPGAWGLPATSISIWIEPTYDSKTKQWSAGYWQPDREDSYEQPTPPSETSAPTTSP